MLVGAEKSFHMLMGASSVDKEGAALAGEDETEVEAEPEFVNAAPKSADAKACMGMRKAETVGQAAQGRIQAVQISVVPCGQDLEDAAVKRDFERGP